MLRGIRVNCNGSFVDRIMEHRFITGDCLHEMSLLGSNSVDEVERREV